MKGAKVELMMDKLGAFVGGLTLSGVLLGLILPTAFARMDELTVYDQWNTLAEFEDISNLRTLLTTKDWADEKLDVKELDRVLVLTQQLSSEFFPNVPPELALAVISVESGFQSRIESPKGAQGLMQVVPKYHKERIEKYRYEENVDLYDPRLNIMVGTDYLDYILTETNGDLVYALMWYNGGARYAQNNYEYNGITSEYAKTVLKRMEAIQKVLERR